MLMKRFVFFLGLFLFGIAFLIPTPTKAQTSQNVILSCLDATPLEPERQLLNGVEYHHLLSLKNKDIGVFSPNQPVYIVRSLPRVICPPGSDPECIKDEIDTVTACQQEIVGANACNQTCPWEGHSCTPNNYGPGVTVCCMPRYTKQGPYFECANDKNKQSTCPQSIMATENQTNGIHIAENGHIETSGGSDFTLVNVNKGELLADENGNIFIDAAQSYTVGGLEHSFYAMQVVSDQAISDNEAYRNSLKLSLFAQIEEVEPSATNCTTVFWDPYGKIIDSLHLEPLGNINILLKNKTINNQIIKTVLANNPTFRNPNITDLGGNFNFAVSPGTYFLQPSHPDFTFPIDSSTFNSVVSKLTSFDPQQEYIARDNLYNNSLEPIIEKEGFSQRRDIILQPKDPNYPGSPISILYAENLRDGNNQLVRGRASHPNSLIQITINNTQVAQTQTDLNGGFNITIPQSVITNNPGFLQIFAQKTPITNPISQKFPPFVKLFIKNALAQTPSISKPYSLSLVPLRMSGFVFDTNLQVKPGAIVQLSIPSLGGINYSQTKADENGFVSINNTNLPPLDFVLIVKDPENTKNTYKLTVDDFKKTNTVYINETQANYYNNSVPISKPDSTLIAKVKAQTPNKVSPNNLSFNQPTPLPLETIDSNKPGNNKVFLVVFGLIIAIIVLLALVVVRKNHKQKPVYY